MKQTKKYLGGLLALLFVAGTAMAGSINTPSVGSGQLSPKDAPCVTKLIGAAEGTTETLVFSGVGYLAWVLQDSGLSSGARYLTLQDSNVADAAGTNLMLLYSGTPTANQLTRFDPPLVLSNGLTATNVAGTWAVLCYRTYAGSTP